MYQLSIHRERQIRSETFNSQFDCKVINELIPELRAFKNQSACEYTCRSKQLYPRLYDPNKMQIKQLSDNYRFTKKHSWLAYTNYLVQLWTKHFCWHVFKSNMNHSLEPTSTELWILSSLLKKKTFRHSVDLTGTHQ